MDLFEVPTYNTLRIWYMLGGLWYYTEDSTDGQACVMKSTIINTSKEMMCYSDYPIPKEFPIYMHNKYVLKYFNLYADKFNVRKYINFRTQVSFCQIGDLMVQPFPYKMLKLAEFYQLVDTIIIESKTLYIDIFDVKALYTYTFLFIHK